MSKILIVGLMIISQITFAKDAKKNEASLINIVCSTDSCFKKYEDAYANAGCDLSVVNTELIEHERSFTDISVMKTYKMNNCKMATSEEAGISIPPDIKLSCPSDYKRSTVKLDTASRTVCLDKSIPAQVNQRKKELGVQGTR